MTPLNQTHMPFGALGPHTFEYKGDFYLKLERTAGSDFKMIKANAVNLHNGSEAVFDGEDHIVVRTDIVAPRL